MTGERAEDKRAATVSRLESSDIADDDCVLARVEDDIRKLELNTATQLESIHVERRRAHVLHFYILEVLGAVRIARCCRCRMIHDFCDAQPWHGSNECLDGWRAPGVLPGAGRSLCSREKLGIRVDGDRSAIN